MCFFGSTQGCAEGSSPSTLTIEAMVHKSRKDRGLYEFLLRAGILFASEGHKWSDKYRYREQFSGGIHPDTRTISDPCSRRNASNPTALSPLRISLRLRCVNNAAMASSAGDARGLGRIPARPG